MSFFEPPPPPPEPEERHQPVWLGPPENEVGVAVALNILLARSEDVAVAVLNFTAFSTGFEIVGTVRTREQLDDLHDAFDVYRRRRTAELEPELFRFGIEFADGRKATNLGHPFQRASEEDDPSRPVLMPRGSGGGGRSWGMNWWVWPLPPPGPLALVCEWPAHGVALTRHDLDAAPLLEAAAQVEQLWLNGGAIGGSASSVQVAVSAPLGDPQGPSSA